MFNLNQVNLGGTLTRAPELRRTPKGTAVCQFSLAINEVYKDANGNKVESCNFIDCEAWSGTAETIAKYCDKGHTIYVSGSLKQENWTDKESGKNRSKLKVKVLEFKFVAKPKGQQEAESGPPKERAKPPIDPDLDPDWSDDDGIPM